MLPISCKHVLKPGVAPITPKGRPADCDCWDADAELSCWPCYRDGFDIPNPSAGEE